MDKSKASSALMKAAAEFINRESNRRSLITVTKAEIGDRGGRVMIYVSVFPDDQSAAVMDFLGRSRADFANYLKKTIRLRSIPHIDFLHDPNIGGVVKEV
jgi:ribosome-binding factor A